MCRQITCDICNQPSWAGCGMHIDSALARVPYDERCACRARTNEEHQKAKAEGRAGNDGCEVM